MANRDLNTISPHMGRDLRLEYRQSGGFFEDADLATRRRTDSPRRERDLELTESIENFTQAIANRLKTRKGELEALGNPEYGSRHHELIGEPNVDRTRNLIKMFVLRALNDDPRVERVLSLTVRPEHSPPRETVRIEANLRLIGEPAPLNLVVPFSLEVTP